MVSMIVSLFACKFPVFDLFQTTRQFYGEASPPVDKVLTPINATLRIFQKMTRYRPIFFQHRRAQLTLANLHNELEARLCLHLLSNCLCMKNCSDVRFAVFITMKCNVFCYFGLIKWVFLLHLYVVFVQNGSSFTFKCK